MIQRISDDWGKLQEDIQPRAASPAVRGEDRGDTRGEARSEARGEEGELQRILRQVVTVREVLKEMCRVSVTRASLKQAVRDALLPVIREHRDELFPEFAVLSQRLAASGEDLDSILADEDEEEETVPSPLSEEFHRRLNGFEERIQRIAEYEAKFEANCASLAAVDSRQQVEIDGLRADIEDNIRDGLIDVQGKVDGLRVEFDRSEASLPQSLAKLSGDIEARWRSGDEGLRGELRAVRERIEGLFADLGRVEEDVPQRIAQAAGELEARWRQEGEGLRGDLLGVKHTVESVRAHLGRVEDSVPQRISEATADLEARLRREIMAMAQQLQERIEGMQQSLDRIESILPTREGLANVEQRLDQLETCFARMADQVSHIDSATPEVQALADRFASVRNDIAAVISEVERTGLSLSEFRDGFGVRLDEIAKLMAAGIDRWESDQSQMHERLTSLRDGLRDQLLEFSRQVESASKTLWNRVTGRKEGVLKLSGKEFEELTRKLEGIIGGLEQIITRRVVT
jgi:uncharacterized protein YicC (UPF0701 family)